jgi:hypothetical protein
MTSWRSKRRRSEKWPQMTMKMRNRTRNKIARVMEIKPLSRSIFHQLNSK